MGLNIEIPLGIRSLFIISETVHFFQAFLPGGLQSLRLFFPGINFILRLIVRWVGVTEPDIYYNLFHSSSVPPNGANRGRYLNTDLDLLLEQGRKTLDLEARKKIYRQVQQIIASDLPYISLWYQTNVAVLSRRVQGFVLYPDGDFTSLKQVYCAPSE